MGDQTHDFRAGIRIGLIQPPGRAGNAGRARLPNSSDRHTGVSRLDHHQNAAGDQLVLKQIRNFLRHAFLDLRFFRNAFDEPSQFAQTDDAACRDVRNVGPAGEREQVVFAEARKLDISLQNHLFVIDFEGLFQMNTRAGMKTGEDLRIHAGNSVGRFQKAVPVGIFTHCEQDFAHGGPNPGFVYPADGRSFRDGGNLEMAVRGTRLVQSVGIFQNSALFRMRREITCHYERARPFRAKASRKIIGSLYRPEAS